MSEVFTKTSCLRCKVVEIRPGANASYPPGQWSEMKLTKRGTGSGWTNPKYVIDAAEVCPTCTEAIEAFAKMEPKQKKKIGRS